MDVQDSLTGGGMVMMVALVALMANERELQQTEKSRAKMNEKKRRRRKIIKKTVEKTQQYCGRSYLFYLLYLLWDLLQPQNDLTGEKRNIYDKEK